MPTFTLRSLMPVSATELYEWHTRPASFLRLMPPWESARVVDRIGPFGNGQRYIIDAPILGPISKRWIAELYDVEPGQRFRDRQVTGPFAEWNHTHTMIADGPASSTLEDHVEYRLPFGLLGRFGAGLANSRIEAMFRYRHALMASDFRRHQKSPRKLRIGVTGSTGLVGNDLCLFLASGGHDVVRFVRKVPEKKLLDGTQTLMWNPDEALTPEQLAGFDAIIHLAGENIAAGRWTDEQKKRIRESRVGPTRRLAEAIAAASPRPPVFIVASAVGIYGDRGDEVLDEESTSGQGFLGEIGREWEAAADPARAAGVRVVHARFGIVLSPRGGVLGKQLLAFKSGGGAVLGSGEQWVSWISIQDVTGILHHAIINESVQGAVNAVSPNSVTNREFGRVLARVLSRPYLLTLPAPVLRTMFGEMADATLLASQRVMPRRLEQTGYEFQLPTLEAALRFLLGR